MKKKMMETRMREEGSILAGIGLWFLAAWLAGSIIWVDVKISHLSEVAVQDNLVPLEKYKRPVPLPEDGCFVKVSEEWGYDIVISSCPASAGFIKKVPHRSDDSKAVGGVRVAFGLSFRFHGRITIPTCTRSRETRRPTLEEVNDEDTERVV